MEHTIDEIKHQNIRRKRGVTRKKKENRKRKTRKILDHQ